MKRLAIISGVLAVIALGGFLLWQHYWYYLPGIIGNLRNPIAENHEVTWAQGPVVTA